jgi:GT2 family glycosyltransferase
MRSDAAQPSFSVVIPAYERTELLQQTLQVLTEIDYPSDRYEIVIVDHPGGSAETAVTRSAASSRCAVRLERCAAVDAPSKRNLGARLAGGELVLFLNDDIWPAADMLTEHARTHRAHSPAAVAVLGNVEQSPSMPFSPFVEFYRPYAYGAIESRADRAVDWHYFWAPNISVPRRVLQNGDFYFREDWPALVHEDVELGYRWQRAGHMIVYNPRARAQHYHPHTLDSAARLQETIGRYLPLLEQLVEEPGLVERYGVFSWHNSPRGIVRGLVRGALFNAVTVPPIQGWLARRQRNSWLTRWLYWKVLLHYTNRGYQRGQHAARGHRR